MLANHANAYVFSTFEIHIINEFQDVIDSLCSIAKGCDVVVSLQA